MLKLLKPDGQNQRIHLDFCPPWAMGHDPASVAMAELSNWAPKAEWEATTHDLVDFALRRPWLVQFTRFQLK